MTNVFLTRAGSRNLLSSAVCFRLSAVCCSFVYINDCPCVKQVLVGYFLIFIAYSAFGAQETRFGWSTIKVHRLLIVNPIDIIDTPTHM